MTRTYTPWLIALTLLATPALAQEELLPLDAEPWQLEEPGFIDMLFEAEAVVLDNEPWISDEELQYLELDDAFWAEEPAGEAQVVYLGGPTETLADWPWAAEADFELAQEPDLFADGEFALMPEDLELADSLPLEPIPWTGEVEELWSMTVVVDFLAWLLSDTIDSDGDGWSNGYEMTQSQTDPLDADTDDDGWNDGPTNHRYELRLLTMSRDDDYPWYKEAWCGGDDEVYFVVDDSRWPMASQTYGNGAINGYWSLGDDETITLNQVVEQRIKTPTGPGKMRSRIRIYDDDTDLGYHDDWYEDDLYFSFELDLLKATPGQTITVNLSNSCADFVVKFRVETSTFVDPKPLDGGVGDSDLDGIWDMDEAFMARVFEGMGDPYTEDIWIEVDKASDVGWWDNRARYMVVSQFKRHDINLRIDDGRFGGGKSIAHSGSMSSSQWDTAYNTDFTQSRKGIFRYALLVDDLWTGRSGIAWQDRFLVDADRYWFNVWTLTQAGTFMHELGHSLGLTKAKFPNSYIDTTTADINTHYYYSCMNYWYQYRLVDYSEGDDPGKGDLDDWGNLDLGGFLAPRVTVLTAS